ncbi:hypothetical protein SDRG_13106 [Saprolegnia diclina VS20]|uniref:Uncharacterized protein n=1 Tax=Saprolegnia diclina (strain VS20) TaxID=1156394 RepID=T0RAM1_SAPDV|nr:hypothetical protein SDRG_13106 [Saprolegnia diclina VS20]EQC29233.1 hypothetical protein SDRG_13106 [Saprolegnia diclina VS20]|eukprot:XP_008617411.1 hypothetical protein SDRG_13106 [Saprolegnia diclina VS20]
MVASFNLGLTYRFLGDYAAAEALWLPIWDQFQKSPPAPGQYIHLLFLLAQLYWSKGDYVLGKQYLLDNLAWCLAHLPPGDADTSQGASAFYRFLLDPTFAAHNPASDEAWAKVVVAFFAKNELETEVWQDETCFGCSQPMQARALASRRRSATTPPAASSATCHHAGTFSSKLVASATDQATATLWRDYQTYCTANKVPVDEQAAFASYAPIATRTWHPML